MDLTLALLTTFATLVAGIAATAAWVSARQAAQAAVTMTRIEQRRWHRDLTPRFEVTCTAGPGDRAKLRVTLVGPAGLDRLVEVTVIIRDDIRGRAPVVAGGPTSEQIVRQVWGPYRLVPGVDGADETGRRVTPVELLLGDWRPFELQKTNPPPWSAPDQTQWEQSYQGQPVRIALECRYEDHRWTIPHEVPVIHPSP